MDFLPPGAASGITQGLDQYQARQMNEQVMRMRAQEMDRVRLQDEQTRMQQAAALRAQQGAGSTLQQMYAPPPMPGQSSTPMQPPGPPQGGGGPPMVPQGQGMPPPGPPPGPPQQPQGMAPPQPQGPPPIPPYQTVQSAGQRPAAPPQQPQGMMPPPVQPPQPQQQRPTVQGAIQAMQAQGVPPEQWLGQLERLKPVFDEANQAQLAEIKQQKAISDAELRAAKDRETAAFRATQLRQGQERIDNQKAAGQVAQDQDTLKTDAARLRNGAPLSAITRGLGRSATAYANAIKAEAVREMVAEGMTPKQAADELDRAGMMYKGEGQAYAGLEKIAAGQEKIGEKLKLDMDNLKSLLPKGDANSVKVMNTPINKLRSAFSSETYAPFRLQAELVGNEFERQMVGNGLSIAQLPVAAQENAKKVMNGDMSVGEILSIMPTMINDMNNVTQANVKAKQGVLSRLGGKGADKPASPAGPYSDADKEARYQAWKASHANE